MTLSHSLRSACALALVAGWSATALAQDAGEHDPAAAAKAFAKRPN
jgi:hypothetical protein